MVKHSPKILASEDKVTTTVDISWSIFFLIMLPMLPNRVRHFFAKLCNTF